MIIDPEHTAQREAAMAASRSVVATMIPFGKLSFYGQLCDLLDFLSKSERADPGVWLAVLQRRAKTGKRLANGAQAVIILANRPITIFRCDQVAVCDVVAGSA